MSIEQEIDLDALEALCDNYLRECPDYWYEECHLADGITYEPAVYFMIDASPEMVKALIALARKAQEPAPSAWLPIESAPRDGTMILLGRAEEEMEHDGLSLPGRWHEGSCDGPDEMGHDAGFMDDGFFGYFRCGRSFGNPDYQHSGHQPTHWQTMPNPPAKETNHVPT